ncbi:MAG: hypothetical protein QNJ30_12080 [Kiloniellales bacterium]|nr:hypothetical protein [Kiloniellales bacterium]
MPFLPGSNVAFGAGEAETLRQALEQEKLKSAALEAELEKTRSEMQARIDEARDELSTRLEELFASVTWKSDPEVAVLRRKLDAAGAEIAGLTSAKENSRAYASRLETRLRDVNRKVEGLEVAAGEAAARFQKELAASEETIEGLKAAVAEAEAARAETAAQVEQARAKQDVWANRVVGANNAALIAAADAQAQREKVEGLEAKLEETGSERDALKQELEQAEREIGARIERVFAAASGAANSEVETLRKELEASNKQIVSLEASGGAAQALEAELASLRKESRRLEAAVETAETARAAAEARLNESQGGKQDELRELRKTAQALTAERDAAKTEIGKLAKILQTTQQQAQGLQEALSRSQEARKRVGGQLEAALARAEAQGRALAAAKASSAETATLRRQLSDTKGEMSRIRQELTRARAEVDAARGEISQRIGQLIAAAAEKESSPDVVRLKEKLAAAEQEIARLAAALKARQEAGSVNN